MYIYVCVCVCVYIYTHTSIYGIYIYTVYECYYYYYYYYYYIPYILYIEIYSIYLSGVDRTLKFQFLFTLKKKSGISYYFWMYIIQNNIKCIYDIMYIHNMNFLYYSS